MKRDRQTKIGEYLGEERRELEVKERSELDEEERRDEERRKLEVKELKKIEEEERRDIKEERRIKKIDIEKAKQIYGKAKIGARAVGKEVGKELGHVIKKVDEGLDKIGFRTRISPMDLISGKKEGELPKLTLSKETQDYMYEYGVEKTAKLIASKLKLGKDIDVALIENKLINYMLSRYGKWW